MIDWTRGMVPQGGSRTIAILWLCDSGECGKCMRCHVRSGEEFFKTRFVEEVRSTSGACPKCKEDAVCFVFRQRLRGHTNPVSCRACGWKGYRY